MVTRVDTDDWALSGCLAEPIFSGKLEDWVLSACPFSTLVETRTEADFLADDLEGVDDLEGADEPLNAGCYGDNIYK